MRPANDNLPDWQMSPGLVSGVFAAAFATTGFVFALIKVGLPALDAFGQAVR